MKIYTLKDMLICIVVYIIVFVTLVLESNATVNKLTTELTDTKAKLAVAEAKIAPVPDFLSNAYTKCSKDKMNEKWQRQCIAFEIKELNR